MKMPRTGCSSRIAVALLAVLAGGLPCIAGAQAQTSACGPIANAYGPFDYRVYKGRNEIKIVEDFHFNAAVENLIKPMSSQFFGGDFDYTLRASPNHHRALISLTRYAERVKLPTLPGMHYPVECYFDRAIRFARDDLVVRMIYAGYLGRQGRAAEAMAQLDYVVVYAGDNAFTHYNAGLGYLELREFGKALNRAHMAAQLGLPRTELRDKLKAAGKWAEPAPSTDAAVPVPVPVPDAAASSAKPAS